MTLYRRAACASTPCATVHVILQHRVQYADTPNSGLDCAHSPCFFHDVAVFLPRYSTLAYGAGAVGGSDPKRQRAHCIVLRCLSWFGVWYCSEPHSTESTWHTFCFADVGSFTGDHRMHDFAFTYKQNKYAFFVRTAPNLYCNARAWSSCSNDERSLSCAESSDTPVPIGNCRLSISSPHATSLCEWDIITRPLLSRKPTTSRRPRVGLELLFSHCRHSCASCTLLSYLSLLRKRSVMAMVTSRSYDCPMWSIRSFMSSESSGVGVGVVR